MAAGAVYREITCKTALTRVEGMPFQWSLDPFVGCQHGCVYCYAREYHAKRGRDIGVGFDREIEAKANFAEVLRAELAAGPKAGVVALGTGTDPYQPLEGRYPITRRALEVLADRPMPLVVVTKSPLIVRDVDLLTRLNRRTRGAVRVYFSVGTVDPDLAALTEPSTAPPLRRLEAMRRVREGASARACSARRSCRGSATPRSPSRRWRSPRPRTGPTRSTAC